MPRLYFPDDIPAHGECTLPRAQAHHVAHVLRLTAGDAVTLFDGHGIEYPATIVRIGKRGIVVRIGGARAVDRESPLHVTLVQAVSGGERMDYTIQKAVELGVAHVQPVISQRSVVRLKSERAEKRVAHWQYVVIAACEQCGRNLVPEVAPVLPLMDWLATLPAGGAGRLLLSPHAERRFAELPRPDGGIILLAGPEGGFDGAEIEMALTRGFVTLSLGPRVLRTETAALVALALLQSKWGDF
ncbi:MAG TPA: 16S rRNA (uracil(1498)-N(3))-methyltransferase [Burkholderiales bacterium]|nr:16S rRNA (uracil(1498)-N(3))-methyltransferase [Burkholderiales bacterium]